MDIECNCTNLRLSSSVESYSVAGPLTLTIYLSGDSVIMMTWSQNTGRNLDEMAKIT